MKIYKSPFKYYRDMVSYRSLVFSSAGYYLYWDTELKVNHIFCDNYDLETLVFKKYKGIKFPTIYEPV